MEERPGEVDAELERICEILGEHPEGISEYELLRELRGPAPVGGLDPLELFRVHFLLFHHLYRLRRRLEREGSASLEIHCLCIRLGPPPPPGRNPEALPSAPDPLAAYYLDLDQLRLTTSEDVQALLRSFWRRMKVYGREGEAREVLGLGPRATALEVRQRYRELARRHHPDAGGDPEHFLRLSEAMEVLRAFGMADASS